MVPAKHKVSALQLFPICYTRKNSAAPRAAILMMLLARGAPGRPLFCDPPLVRSVGEVYDVAILAKTRRWSEPPQILAPIA